MTILIKIWEKMGCEAQVDLNICSLSLQSSRKFIVDGTDIGKVSSTKILEMIQEENQNKFEMRFVHPSNKKDCICMEMKSKIGPQKETKKLTIYINYSQTNSRFNLSLF
jgi:hypothetical protein